MFTELSIAITAVVWGLLFPGPNLLCLPLPHVVPFSLDLFVSWRERGECNSWRLEGASWIHLQQVVCVISPGVVFWPNPGWECMVDVALCSGGARNQVKTWRWKAAYSSNNLTPSHWIYICWSLLGESKSVTTRWGLGSGNTPVANTSLSWLFDVS
jgi:hypothetical protein